MRPDPSLLVAQMHARAECARQFRLDGALLDVGLCGLRALAYEFLGVAHREPARHDVARDRCLRLSRREREQTTRMARGQRA